MPGDTKPSIRVATRDDVPGIRAILAAHGNDDPAGELRGPDVVGPYLRHLMSHHIAMVSVTPEDGVVAFGAVANAGLAWHLADLFVQPEMLGQGIGRPLLAAMFEDRWPRTTFASNDPRALPSYVRAGMTPRWPVLYIQGGPDGALRAGRDARALGLEVVGGDPAELVALELDWTGADRSLDMTLFSRWPGADLFVIRDADGPVAVGGGRDRQVGPAVRAVDRLVVRPGAEPVGPVLAAIARCMAAGEMLEVLVPGPHPALPTLLELGFTIEDTDTYCAGPTDPIDAARRLVNPGLL